MLHASSDISIGIKTIFSSLWFLILSPVFFQLTSVAMNTRITVDSLHNSSFFLSVQ